MDNTRLEFLHKLEGIIHQRVIDDAPESYTATLVAAGDKRVAQKVGEEAVELALAATAGDRDEQLQEAADLLYHLLVLLKCKSIALDEVVGVLQDRHRPESLT
ncbi:MAG: phosphoribosyl-ATP pyrophosphohydrolase [Woeseiaceae bacterium]|jgi:phosphoribosyl-ATP pyrophosphohydrolase